MEEGEREKKKKEDHVYIHTRADKDRKEIKKKNTLVGSSTDKA
jgi:hypothetical protein